MLPWKEDENRAEHKIEHEQGDRLEKGATKFQYGSSNAAVRNRVEHNIWGTSIKRR
jgi:hypothetical protein